MHTLASDLERGEKEISVKPTGNVTKQEVDEESPSKSNPAEERYLVNLDAEEDPRNISKYRKWIIIFVLCSGALCSTCSTSMVRMGRINYKVTWYGRADDLYVGCIC